MAAYRAALEEYICERVPLDWAAIQTNLGFALLSFGLWTQDCAKLKEAGTAISRALEVFMQTGHEHRGRNCNNLLSQIEKTSRS